MSRATVWILHLAVTVMAATGFWLAWIVLLAAPAAETETEMFAVQDPWQPLLNAVHIVTGPLLIFLVGLIWREHVWQRIGFANAQRRNSGVLLVLLLGPLVVCGYALQVVEDDVLRDVFSWTHAAAGVLFAAVYLVHLLLRPARNGDVAPPEA